MTRLVLPNTGDLTAFGRDLGTGTALPTTGPGSSALRRGDAYFHTGLTCLMVYNGTAWRQAHLSVVADDAAVAAIATTYSTILHEGFRARSAATDIESSWTGTAFWPERTAPVTPALPSPWAPFGTWRPPHYWRDGRSVHVGGMVQVATGQTVGANTEIVVLTLPVGFRPPADLMGRGLVNSIAVCRIDIAASNGTVEIVASNGAIAAGQFVTFHETFSLD